MFVCLFLFSEEQIYFLSAPQGLRAPTGRCPRLLFIFHSKETKIHHGRLCTVYFQLGLSFLLCLFLAMGGWLVSSLYSVIQLHNLENEYKVKWAEDCYS